MTRAELERIRAVVETAERLGVDPLGFVPRDASLHRKEIASFMAAGLAHLDEPHALGYQAHRWIRGPDIAAMVGRIQVLQQEFGSLGAAFADSYRPGDMKASMSVFARRLREGLPQTRGVVSLSACPEDGSACKRMNLFMRWAVRPGPTDLGLWPQVRPADLVMPLDVHVIRFARLYGLTTRATVNWKMAEEVTAWFRALCPEDPLRWDFAISHWGMMRGWA